MTHSDGLPRVKRPLGLAVLLSLWLPYPLWAAAPPAYAQHDRTEAPREAGHAHGKDSEETLENKSIKILSVKVISQNLICTPDKQVEIIYKAKADFAPQTIIIDMFDAAGNQIPGTRAGTEGLYTGEVKPTFFCIPPQAASYKVRLPKHEE